LLEGLDPKLGRGRRKGGEPRERGRVVDATKAEVGIDRTERDRLVAGGLFEQGGERRVRCDNRRIVDRDGGLAHEVRVGVSEETLHFR
jgi:hypothetical protein